jgi:hypothetical protein
VEVHPFYAKLKVKKKRGWPLRGKYSPPDRYLSVNLLSGCTASGFFMADAEPGVEEYEDIFLECG